MYPVKICNETIACTNETKCLVVTLDSKLTHRTHISCILRKLQTEATVPDLKQILHH
jgi:hypothetical protein